VDRIPFIKGGRARGRIRLAGAYRNRLRVSGAAGKVGKVDAREIRGGLFRIQPRMHTWDGWAWVRGLGKSNHPIEIARAHPTAPVPSLQKGRRSEHGPCMHSGILLQSGQQYAASSTLTLRMPSFRYYLPCFLFHPKFGKAICIKVAYLIPTTPVIMKSKEGDPKFKLFPSDELF
jgi:hypothetical protein